MHKSLSLLALCGLSSIGLGQVQVQIDNQVLLTTLPSASGVEQVDNRIMVVGDDSPFLFSLNDDLKVNQKSLIKSYPMRDNGRIVKADKPDFEAMGTSNYMDEPILLILGSGSKSPTRDVGFLRDLKTGEQFELGLTDLYQHLFKVAGMTPEQELNIEGLAFTGEYAVLANRGNSAGNYLFIANEHDFMAYLTDQNRLFPEFEVVKVELPYIGQFQAGLSGLDYFDGQMYFTASVEGTDNAYADGAVLGSFVGRFKLDDIDSGYLDLVGEASILIKNDRLLVTKAESIVVIDDTQAVVASDNDDGQSELFRLTISQ